MVSIKENPMRSELKHNVHLLIQYFFHLETPYNLVFSQENILVLICGEMSKNQCFDNFKTGETLSNVRE